VGFCDGLGRAPLTAKTQKHDEADRLTPDQTCVLWEAPQGAEPVTSHLVLWISNFP
jgi:hypothetical protein